MTTNSVRNVSPLPTITFVTIGVYGFAAERFSPRCEEAGVDTVCESAGRGGRGAEYAFANSVRLQARLAELGIRYIHRLDLAPAPALRARQADADRAAQIAKRGRDLGPAFVAGYLAECLAGFDAAEFAADLGPDTRVVALLCVEREPGRVSSLAAGRAAFDTILGARQHHGHR